MCCTDPVVGDVWRIPKAGLVFIRNVETTPTGFVLIGLRHKWVYLKRDVRVPVTRVVLARSSLVQRIGVHSANLCCS